MSCPNWSHLARDRRAVDASDEGQRAWQEALHHAADCADCRGREVEADPLALLTPLAEDLPPLADVDDMRQAVAAMRRGARVRTAPPAAPSKGWPRFAAAAGLAVALVGLGAGMTERSVPTSEGITAKALPPTLESEGAVPEVAPEAAEPAAELAASPWHLPTGAPTDEWLGLPSPEGLAELPVFDELQSPQAASVYQLAGDDLHVVMVVHETLDV